MKLGPIHTTPAADAATLAQANAQAGAAAAKARGGAESAAAAGAGFSSVQLSSAAAGLRAAGNAAPEFDAAKVERMKQAIADGSFQVDAAAIADKLIANAQELLGAARR